MTTALVLETRPSRFDFAPLLQANTNVVGDESISVQTGILKALVKSDFNLVPALLTNENLAPNQHQMLNLMLLQELASVGQYIDNVWRISIIARIRELLDPEDWDNDAILPSIDSFKTFLRMAVYVNPSRRPGLAIAPNGNFVAIWANGSDRMFVETRPKDRMRWVLSKQSKAEPDIASGEAGIHRILDVTQPYGPDDFFQK